VREAARIKVSVHVIVGPLAHLADGLAHFLGVDSMSALTRVTKITANHNILNLQDVLPDDPSANFDTFDTFVVDSRFWASP
jgi:hypothetical protein